MSHSHKYRLLCVSPKVASPIISAKRALTLVSTTSRTRSSFAEKRCCCEFVKSICADDSLYHLLTASHGVPIFISDVYPVLRWRARACLKLRRRYESPVYIGSMRDTNMNLDRITSSHARTAVIIRVKMSPRSMYKVRNVVRKLLCNAL